MDVPSSISASAKRERSYYHTEERAKTKARREQERADSFSRTALGLDDDQKIIAAKALTRLLPGRSLLEAVDFANAAWKAEVTSKTFASVLEEFLAVKRAENRSDRHMSDLRSRLTRFARDFGERGTHTIARQEVRQWITELKQTDGSPMGAQSKTNYRRVLANVFGFAAQEGYLEANPVAGIKSPQVIASPVSILIPSEAGALLNAAREHRFAAKGQRLELSSILPVVALGLFGGLRPGEIYDLRWSAIHFEQGQIEVAATLAKTRRHRLTPILAVLAAWLEPYRHHRGRVAPYSL